MICDPYDWLKKKGNSKTTKGFQYTDITNLDKRYRKHCFYRHMTNFFLKFKEIAINKKNIYTNT